MPPQEECTLQCSLACRCLRHLTRLMGGPAAGGREAPRAIVALPTGSGKTRIALDLIDYGVSSGILKPCRASIILAPLNVIINQFAAAASEKWGSECVSYIGDTSPVPRSCKIMLLYSSKSGGADDTIPRTDFSSKSASLAALLRYTLKSCHRPGSKCRNCHYVIAVTPHLLYYYRRRMGEAALESLAKLVDVIIVDEAHYGYPIRWSLYSPPAGGHADTLMKLLEFGRPKMVLALTATPTPHVLQLIAPEAGTLGASGLRETLRRKLCIEDRPCYATIKEAASAGCVIGQVRLLAPIDARRGILDFSVISNLRWYADVGLLSGLTYKALEALYELASRVAAGPPRVLVVAASTEIASLLAVSLRELLDRRPLGAIRVGVLHSNLVEHLEEGYPGLERVLGEAIGQAGVGRLQEHKLASKILKAFRDEGRVNVLIAVNMLSLGFNDPNLDAIILGRPIASLNAYIQLRGRLLRRPSTRANSGSLKALTETAYMADLSGFHVNLERLIATGGYDICSPDRGHPFAASWDPLELDVELDLKGFDPLDIHAASQRPHPDDVVQSFSTIDFELGEAPHFNCINANDPRLGRSYLVYSRLSVDCFSVDTRPGSKCLCPSYPEGSQKPDYVVVYEILSQSAFRPIAAIYCKKETVDGMLRGNKIEQRQAMRILADSKILLEILSEDEKMLLKRFHCEPIIDGSIL